MTKIFLATFPFFGLILCGYLGLRRGLMPVEAIPGLNTFVLYFALPCMLYRFGATTPIDQLLNGGTFVVWSLAALAMVGITIVTTRRQAGNWNDTAFGALVAAFPNTGFMGLPLLVDLGGAPAAVPAIISLGIDMVMTSSLCIALSRLDRGAHADAGASFRKALAAAFLNPLPWSILLGGLASATGFHLYQPVVRLVDMLASTASPMGLFTVGAVLARSQLRGDYGRGKAAPSHEEAPLVLYKLLLHPVLVLAIGAAARAAGIPLDAFSLAVLVLVAALPSASNVAILAERFEARTGRIAKVVLFSTVLAFFTYPATVALIVRQVPTFTAHGARNSQAGSRPGREGSGIGSGDGGGNGSREAARAVGR